MNKIRRNGLDERSFLIKNQRQVNGGNINF